MFKRLIAIAAVGVLAATPLQAQPRGLVPVSANQRQGFWIGFGVGGGSIGANCADCTTDRTGGVTGFLRLGGTISQHVLLGGEIDGWGKKQNGVTGSMGFGSFIASIYPTANAGFFLQLGLGGMTYTEDDGIDKIEATAPAGSFGLGYDFRVGRMLSVTPFINALASSAVSFKINGVSPPVGADRATVQNGDTILWYWSAFTEQGGSPTLVLRKRPVIPGIVTAGLATVALRMPDHPVALDLIRAAGVPIAAPSANPFGRLSPTRAEHVCRQLGEAVALILDGGPCRVGVESTVVLLAEGRAALLRPGGLPVEALEAVVGPLESPASDEARSLSPGRAGVHYAPRSPIVIAAPHEPLIATHGERLGLLAADEAGRRLADELGGPFAAVEVLAEDGDPVVSAARLFDALHRLEEAGVERIVAQPVVEVGLGRAGSDRLRRAAATMPGLVPPSASNGSAPEASWPG